MKEHPENNTPEHTNEEASCKLCEARWNNDDRAYHECKRTRDLNNRWVKTATNEIHNLNVVDARRIFDRYAMCWFADPDTWSEHVPPQGVPWSAQKKELSPPTWDRLDPSSENDNEWILSNREAQTFMARDLMYAITEAYGRIKNDTLGTRALEKYFAPTGKVLTLSNQKGCIYDRSESLRFILKTLYVNAMTTLHHAALFECKEGCDDYHWNTDCEFCYPEVAYDGLPFCNADEEVRWSQVREEYETGVTPVVTDCACTCNGGAAKKTNSRQKSEAYFATNWDNGEGEE